MESERLAEIEALLTGLKPQIILQGPPGTGKTHLAKLLANQLAGPNGNGSKPNSNVSLQSISDQKVGAIIRYPSSKKPYIVAAIGAFTDKNPYRYLVSKTQQYNSKKEFDVEVLKAGTGEILENYVEPLWNELAIIAKSMLIEREDKKARNVGDAAIEEYDSAIEEPNPFATLIQFHPAYSYEDFVRGITATTVGDKVNYVVEDKTLALLAVEAAAHSENNYVLIIDEINRANLPAVLGELIYSLEYRDEPVTSMYALPKVGREITLPGNLYIIGTMNTADRSAGQIDIAIRRRFAFVEVLPDRNVVESNSVAEAPDLFDSVAKLFVSDQANWTPATETLSSEFQPKDVMPGHSYFLAENIEQLKLKLDYEIKPLLREYLRDGILLESARIIIEELSVK